MTCGQGPRPLPIRLASRGAAPGNGAAVNGGATGAFRDMENGQAAPI